MEPQMDARNNVMGDVKRNFNILWLLCVMHQRALTIPLRTCYGKEALGMPCLFAVLMMILWGGLANDGVMFWYLVGWLVLFAHRRVQAITLARTGRMHSAYDGRSIIAKNDTFAKAVLEPVLIGAAGYCVLQLYQEWGWSPQGLPYFLLLGCFTLPFVEMAKRQMWQRRTQSMINARIESEAVMAEFHRRYGQ